MDCTNACVTNITLVDIVSILRPVSALRLGSVAEVVVTAMLSFEELSSNICLHVSIVCIFHILWRIEVGDLSL